MKIPTIWSDWKWGNLAESVSCLWPLQYCLGPTFGRAEHWHPATTNVERSLSQLQSSEKTHGSCPLGCIFSPMPLSRPKGHFWQVQTTCQQSFKTPELQIGPDSKICPVCSVTPVGEGQTTHWGMYDPTQGGVLPGLRQQSVAAECTGAQPLSSCRAELNQ